MGKAIHIPPIPITSDQQLKETMIHKTGSAVQVSCRTPTTVAGLPKNLPVTLLPLPALENLLACSHHSKTPRLVGGLTEPGLLLPP